MILIMVLLNLDYKPFRTTTNVKYLLRCGKFYYQLYGPGKCIIPSAVTQALCPIK